MEITEIKAHALIKEGLQKNKKIIRVAAYCRVSTDTEDQMNSYRSQVHYYTELIKSKNEWAFVDIYADAATTGTMINKRENFQRMINDALDDKIDMIITRSISRFARNTLDTLKYVHTLKEKRVAVFFEEENINTLTMDGELLLVVLSSVAQQEVENISENVKKGLKMRMKRGELVGSQACLGYDYDTKKKRLIINKEEAEVVKLIFKLYIEGNGSWMIARKLNELGIHTKHDRTWTSSGVLGILRNEKYKGDVLLGKTYTVDPITKRRLSNYGEEDQYYLKDHHEPIISEEVFKQAEYIRLYRATKRNVQYAEGGNRTKYSRKYAFSSKVECGFCGRNYSRATWHSNNKYHKRIWKCMNLCEGHKDLCPNRKAISEEVLEQIFVDLYNSLNKENGYLISKFIKHINNVLRKTDINALIENIENKINQLEKSKKRLIDMNINQTIDEEMFNEKYADLEIRHEELRNERSTLLNKRKTNKSLGKRLQEFKRVLETGNQLEEFDREVFDGIVEKVIIGEKFDDGAIDPHKVIFILNGWGATVGDYNTAVAELKKKKPNCI